MYQQPINLLCHPNLESIPLYNYILHVNYVDQLDEMAVEFPHRHPSHYEIYYVLEGTLTLMANDDVFQLPKHHFMLLNHNTKHGAIYTPYIPKNYIVIVFDIEQRTGEGENVNSAQFEKAHLKAFFEIIEKTPFIISEDTSGGHSYVTNMLSEVTNKGFGWEFILRSLYMSFIISVLRNVVNPEKNTRSLPRMNLPIAITKYLHANYHHNISLQDIADEFHITTRHANRLFNEYFGTSLRKTLTLYRLSYAKNYLMDTNFSVEKIAESVGFSSASTLSRLFKDNEGITISQYRGLIHSKSSPLNVKRVSKL